MNYDMLNVAKWMFLNLILQFKCYEMGSSLPWSSMQHSPSDRRIQRGPKSFRADQQRIYTFVYPRISQPLPFSVLENPGVSKSWILFLILDQNDAAKSRP